MTALRATLLAEMHRAIDAAASDGLAMLQLRGIEPAYPPGVELSDAELTSLASLTLTVLQRSAIEKVLRDVASRPLFQLLSLVDGVADPARWDGPWLGAHITEATEESSEGAMWHDDFFESYWAYLESSAPDV